MSNISKLKCNLLCACNESGECKNLKIVSEYNHHGKVTCTKRKDENITYAEEQLEHAKENKTNLMEQVKKCVNYEKGYFELLKENEELKATNKGLVEEIKDNNINYQVNIEELHKEIDQVMGEKEKYHTQMVILQEDNKEYKRANEGLAAESKDRLQAIKNLKRQIEDNTENAILSNKVEDLEKERDQIKTYNMELTSKLKEKESEITNLNELIEKKDIKIEKLEKELDEKKSESAEFYLLWGDAESKSNKLQGESNAFEKMVDILRAKGEEKDKLIEEMKLKSTSQIETIKKLASLL